MGIYSGQKVIRTERNTEKSKSIDGDLEREGLLSLGYQEFFPKRRYLDKGVQGLGCTGILQTLREECRAREWTTPRSSDGNKVSKLAGEERRGGAVITKVKGQIM